MKFFFFKLTKLPEQATFKNKITKLVNILKDILHSRYFTLHHNLLNTQECNDPVKNEDAEKVMDSTLEGLKEMGAFGLQVWKLYFILLIKMLRRNYYYF